MQVDTNRFSTITMKLFAVLTTTAALAIATAQAKMSCHKAGQPHSLKYHVQGKGGSGSYNTKFSTAGKKGPAYLRVHDGVSDEKFVFYECNSAPDGFTTTTSGHGKFGQVRSAKDPKKCLSVQGVDNRSAITGGKYEKKNGFLTMEDCNENSPRLQWWRKNKFDESYLNYVGKKGDAVRDSAMETKDETVYMYKFELDSNLPFEGEYRPFLKLE